jgi:hypothetical protein
VQRNERVLGPGKGVLVVFDKATCNVIQRQEDDPRFGREVTGLASLARAMSAQAGVLVDTLGIVKSQENIEFVTREGPRNKLLVTVFDPLHNKEAKCFLYSVKTPVPEGKIFIFLSFKMVEHSGRLSLVESFRSIVREAKLGNFL